MLLTIMLITFMVLLSVFNGLAEAQQGTATAKGKVKTAKNLVFEKTGPGSLYLSGKVYRYSLDCDFDGVSGEPIGRSALVPGNRVDIVYLTEKFTTEDYPFDPRDSVLTRVQVVSTRK